MIFTTFSRASSNGFLKAEEINVGTGLELAEEDPTSLNNTHLGMVAVSTGQGTEYDGDVSNDEEMSSQVYVSLLDESNETGDLRKSHEVAFEKEGQPM
ncbi:hypothetical protein RRG08_047637 [Elysia crispata]|uniref:Uncharacterized protein n=1 Tax=Elysia crispata TaxID=231223 RepID=A0AAE0Y787_9GAST|nr:hypothetical protein RRG08_047637 [Elysia crispata]